MIRVIVRSGAGAESGPSSARPPPPPTNLPPYNQRDAFTVLLNWIGAEEHLIVHLCKPAPLTWGDAGRQPNNSGNEDSEDRGFCLQEWHKRPKNEQFPIIAVVPQCLLRKLCHCGCRPRVPASSHSLRRGSKVFLNPEIWPLSQSHPDSTDN